MVNEAQDFMIDFGDKPPAQGSGGKDYVPPGTYLLDTTKAVYKETAKGKPAVVVTFEVAQPQQYVGKSFEVWFVGQGQPSDSKFGFQRLHALVIACGYQQLATAQSASQICKAVTGKKVLTEIEDKNEPAQGQYPARTVSDLVAFWSTKSDEGKAALAKAKARAAATNGVAEPTAADLPELAAEAAAPALAEVPALVAAEPEPAAVAATEAELASDLSAMFDTQ